MGQEARTTGNLGKPADLRVLRAGGEHASPMPKDFVAEVERRARVEGHDEPEHGETAFSSQTILKKPVVVGGGVLAVVILAVALAFVGGSGSSDETGNAVVASNTGEGGGVATVATNEASPADDAAAISVDGLDATETGDPSATEPLDAPVEAVAGFGGFGSEFSYPAITTTSPIALDTTIGDLAYHEEPSGEVILAAFRPEGSVDMPWLDHVDRNMAPYWSEAKPATLTVTEISATTAGGYLTDGTASVPTDVQDTQASASHDQVVASSDELVATKSATIAAPPKGTRIQLAAYVSEERANAAWSELQASHGDMLADLQPMVESALLDSGTYYRLQAGPFGSAGDAESFCQQLLERQLDCIVVPR